jgi:hypothetical protein
MRKRVLLSIVLCLFLFIVSFHLTLLAGEGNSSSSCYCCKKNGIVQLTSKTDCKKNGGKCFGSQAKAAVYCSTLHAKCWCCTKQGKVQQIIKTDCEAWGGKCFGSKEKAKSHCSNQQYECWCCVDGDMKNVPAEICKKEGVTCYTSEEEAMKHRIDCIQRIITVICCVDNKIFMLTEEDCKSKNGKIYPTMEEAKKECTTTGSYLKRILIIYYCCDNGKVIKTTFPSQEQRCYEKKEEAERECQNGWCCEKGKLYEAKVSNCLQNGGVFFDTKENASKACEPYWESNCYCCIDKKTYLHPPIVCKEKNGKCYYGNEMDATIKCARGEE